MSIQIGDLNIANEIIELHFQVIRTQLILDNIFKANPTLQFPEGVSIKSIEDEAIVALQKKFPNMGIKRK